MLKHLPLLFLLAACAQTTTTAPAPQAVPKPQTQTQTKPAEDTTAYTLYGFITAKSECDAPPQNQLYIQVTLANAQHSVTIDHRRFTVFLGTYNIVTRWKNEWGPPTVWRDMVATRVDGGPICQGTCKSGSCSGGIVPFEQAVSSTSIKHDIQLHCGCAQ